MRCSLVERLQRQAEVQPEATALIHGDQRWSYQRLWDQVLRVAGWLRGAGVEPGERVALLMANRPEYVAVYYGILACGGVAVALNTAARSDELADCLRHCGARLLFADGGHSGLPGLLERWSGRTVTVGAADAVEAVDWNHVAHAAPAAVQDYADNQLAAIIYTSGTTGRPKGVMLSHGNLSSNVDAILDYLELTAADRALAVLPFYYSYGNSVLHTHLAVGGSLLLENSLAFPHRLLERTAEERVTGLPGVATLFALLLARCSLERYDLAALRYVTQAGGPMPPRDIRRLCQKLPQVRFYMMYGQTEATARLAYLPPERLSDKLGSVGVPVPGVELQVRGEHGAAVAPGEEGEIWARGPNIMLGYWRDPEATREVRRGDWLRTGDLGRQDEDGFFYVSGRASAMIKTGAHRISPYDIEAAIAELDGVSEVVVMGEPDELLGQVVKALVVAEPGATIEERVIRRHCRQRLAPYKIPKYVEFAAELPKTASGKVRRQQKEGRP